MPKIYSLDDQMERLYVHSISSNRGTNGRDVEKMRKMLMKAMTSCLTEKQLQCMKMYYFEEMNMTGIGKALGINQSTVSRHLAAARHRLERLRTFVE